MFDNPFKRILDNGVGKPGSEQRKKASNDLFEALDSLDTGAKVYMFNELMTDKPDDKEELLGLLAITCYLAQEIDNEIKEN